MKHPTVASLHATLDAFRRRRRAFLLLRQLSVFCAVAALLVFGFTLLFDRLQPSPGLAVLLWIALLALLGLLGWHLCGELRQRHASFRKLAHHVEDHLPDLEQRLLTCLEFSEDELRFGRRGVSQQFIAKLWNDAGQQMRHQQRELRAITPTRRSWWSLAAASATVFAVAGLLLSSASLQDSLTRMIWPFGAAGFVAGAALPPEVELLVEPGDVELQRGDGLTVTARVTGAAPQALTLRLQDDKVNWRDVPMGDDRRGSDSVSFSHYIPEVHEDTLYYATFHLAPGFLSSDDGTRSSRQYRISVFDLPRVEQIDVAFDYPDYTGIDDQLEEDGGDLIAPVGTAVEISVTFNKAIAAAHLEFEPLGEAEAVTELPLSLDGKVGSATFTISEDSLYRVRASDHAGLANPDPLDYHVRTIADQPPELVLRRPGRDQDVMPLEEVLLEIDASDDYGLTRFDLHYSVVGADEAVVDFLPGQQVRNVSGEQLLYLEELGVEPGDFVSYYLSLADNNGLDGPSEVTSDIYFLQVVATDREFRRSQGGGAGAGQGRDSSALVTMQKDIIAATWKLQNRQGQVSAEDFAADAGIIAESQQEAIGRVRMSIGRLSERLNLSDDSYDQAVRNLGLAIEQMNEAAAELGLLQVSSALQPEQAALQYLLKAEANINRTAITMQRGAAAGGSTQQEREGLRELFEMELGQLENRYENPNRRNQSARQQEQANKLEELARRQQGLTRAQRNLARRSNELTEEQRRRELERLMRQQQRLSEEAGQLAQRISEEQRTSSSRQRRDAQNASGSERALQQAVQQMQQAAASDSPSLAAARSQKALDNLRRQQRQLGEQQHRSVNELARNLRQRGERLLEQQRQLREALDAASRELGLGQTTQALRDEQALGQLLEAQQGRQQQLDDIEALLRALIVRGSNGEQRLLSQAQRASRELRPIREEMRASDRVLRDGMVNLAADIEQSLEEQIGELAQDLAQLAPGRPGANPLQQTAMDAGELREQLEELERQLAAYSENGAEPGAGPDTGADTDQASVGELREQLQRSRQLAQQLDQQMRQQARQGSAGRGLGGDRYQTRGEIRTDGGNLPWGKARSIAQQITRQDIEDFLNQPELLAALLQPVIELEGALRAQAELDALDERLHATLEEEIPDEYRDLVRDYYRILSEQQAAEGPAR